jgi:hypothetical protein
MSIDVYGRKGVRCRTAPQRRASPAVERAARSLARSRTGCLPSHILPNDALYSPVSKIAGLALTRVAWDGAQPEGLGRRSLVAALPSPPSGVEPVRPGLIPTYQRRRPAGVWGPPGRRPWGGGSLPQLPPAGGSAAVPPAMLRASTKLDEANSAARRRPGRGPRRLPVPTRALPRRVSTDRGRRAPSLSRKAKVLTRGEGPVWAQARPEPPLCGGWRRRPARSRGASRPMETGFCLFGLHQRCPNYISCPQPWRPAAA